MLKVTENMPLCILLFPHKNAVCRLPLMFLSKKTTFPIHSIVLDTDYTLPSLTQTETDYLILIITFIGNNNEENMSLLEMKLTLFILTLFPHTDYGSQHYSIFIFSKDEYPINANLQCFYDDQDHCRVLVLLQ
jgi:hypothetical protein